MVKLTVCIPTRNRQKYCIETVKCLAKSENMDFEVLVGDNSDDPSQLEDFFNEFDDPRFTRIPPENTVLSMVDNWERMVQYSKGEWVTYIGDDDYIDPKTTEVIAAIERSVPSVDIIDWGGVFYSWPEIQMSYSRIKVCTHDDIYQVPQSEMIRRMFYWENSKELPNCAFGVYHGAAKRELLETVKKTFSGRYFEHQVVDFDSICKCILVSKGMVHCRRPLSIFGACSKSNSAGMTDRKILKERIDTFINETAVEYAPTKFPFGDDLGTTAIVARTILWVSQKYGLEIKGWEKNFAQACAKYCEKTQDRTEFNLRRKGYTKALRKWKGGVYQKYFNPVFKEPAKHGVVFQGLHNDDLYVPAAIGGVQNPYEMYEMLSGVLMPVDMLIARLDTSTKMNKKAA